MKKCFVIVLLTALLLPVVVDAIGFGWELRNFTIDLPDYWRKSVTDDGMKTVWDRGNESDTYGWTVEPLGGNSVFGFQEDPGYGLRFQDFVEQYDDIFAEFIEVDVPNVDMITGKRDIELENCTVRCVCVNDGIKRYALSAVPGDDAILLIVYTYDGNWEDEARLDYIESFIRNYIHQKFEE